ncbi:hypothetical protein [Neopusillimonas aromaticivorans]|uniref:hypothetical protein n=1 Tax=Neopusillimonas aromaticivorans TaxID=2979868 RepID=UPI002596D3E9|nr:hypothetical protein [Neopusillimonas aromaticivorans]WJJ93757.1 hypothetical protein N7E01_00300 [Neopusillimonas aromaticivorans]
MAKKNLSPEIVSLIHHVELNESGWWKKAVSQVVRGVLWQSNSSLSQQQIQDALHHELGIRLSGDILVSQLTMLSSQGSVVTLPGGCYKLSEQARQQLSDARAQCSG